MANISTGDTAQPHIYRLRAFDTEVEFSFWGDDAAAHDAAGIARAECRRFENLFSRTIHDSDVGRINSSANADSSASSDAFANADSSENPWIHVHRDTFDLIRSALDYCAKSQGAFDITIAPIVELWDFKAAHVPRGSDILERRSLVDWRKVELDEGTLSVRLSAPNMKIDLGGIAKGWMADRIISEIMGADLGVLGMIANLGGNVAVAGSKNDGSHFKIGVKDPRDTSRNLLAIPVKQDSVVTSGVYERSFTSKGRLYHHILDPKTGYPVATDLLGATLVCEKSLDAEGFSTTVLALGKERGQAFVRDHPEIEHACLVCDDGELLLL